MAEQVLRYHYQQFAFRFAAGSMVPWVPAKWRGISTQQVQMADGEEAESPWKEAADRAHRPHAQHQHAAQSSLQISPPSPTAPGRDGRSQRVREQDQDGIDAEILFSAGIIHHSRHQGRQRLSSGLFDHALTNRYLAEEDMPNRHRGGLFPMGIIPARGIDDAVKECGIYTKAGLRRVQLDMFPNR